LNPEIITLVEEKCAIRILSIEKMFSRRNAVWLVHARDPGDNRLKYVVKVCAQSNAEQESAILKRLCDWGVAVPAVKWSNHDIIVMEFINGIVLADLMDQAEAVKTGDWIKPLACWLYQLHNVRETAGKVLCVPDLNLRNFINDGKAIVGLDFDEMIWDVPERDLGGISAYILNSSPMFTSEKYRAVGRLVKCYEEMREINRTLIRDYLWREMQAAAERRAAQRDYLLSKIEELQGLDIFSLEMSGD